MHLRFDAEPAPALCPSTFRWRFPLRTRPSTFRIIGLAGLGLGLVIITACSEDVRLKRLSVGIAKDSAIRAMGGESPQRTDPYLVNGHLIEAMMFVEPGLAKPQADSVPERKKVPIVVVDGKVVGWGWSNWDSVTAANKIQGPPRK